MKGIGYIAMLLLLVFAATVSAKDKASKDPRAKMDAEWASKATAALKEHDVFVGMHLDDLLQLGKPCQWNSTETEHGRTDQLVYEQGKHPVMGRSRLTGDCFNFPPVYIYLGIDDDGEIRVVTIQR